MQTQDLHFVSGHRVIPRAVPAERALRRAAAAAAERMAGKPALVRPDPSLRDAFLDLLDDYHQAGEDRYEGFRWAAEADFAQLLRLWADEAAGLNLPPGQAPQHRFWLVEGGERILGMIRIRPRLDREMERTIGNIGYDVRPSERGKGHATRMLHLALAHARKLGMRRAWLTCRKDNAASARVIRKNGGRLHSEFLHHRAGPILQRYRIDLA